MDTGMRRPLDWLNITFLLFVHIVAIVGTALYTIRYDVTLAATVMAVLFTLAGGFSITAGYHRLFAHGAYRAHPALRMFYLVFGASVFENSALKWASDHRRHHAFVDEDNDPYNIRRGFWWAHMGWVFFKDLPGKDLRNVGDLERDPLVRLQHRFYVPLAVGTGFALPLGLGFLLGDPWGCLILAGFLRLVLLYQTTFCVNSLAHTIGTQPYSDRNSSRDSALTAVVTLGEGYHNFHHAFPYDYRNGVRAWQFDPTKWWIHGLGWTGLAREFTRTPDHVILKARLKMQERRALARWLDRPQVVERLRRVQQELEAFLDRWAALKRQRSEILARMDRGSRETLHHLRLEIRDIRRRFRETYRTWRLALRKPELLPAMS